MFVQMVIMLSTLLTLPLIAGGRLVDITPEHHRRLMDFLGRQSTAARNSY